MLKEQVQKGIISFIVTLNVMMILFVGIFMNSAALNAYPIALYLLVLALFFKSRDNLIAQKLGPHIVQYSPSI